jgi:hypothetical protein
MPDSFVHTPRVIDVLSLHPEAARPGRAGKQVELVEQSLADTALTASRRDVDMPHDHAAVPGFILCPYEACQSVLIFRNRRMVHLADPWVDVGDAAIILVQRRVNRFLGEGKAELSTIHTVDPVRRE